MPAGKHGRQASVPAFSLLELLLAVSLIGALTALLVPAIDFARNAARSSQNQSNLRQIYTAAVLWSHDNENYILPVYWPYEQASNPFNPNHWPSLIAPYLGRQSQEPLTSYSDLPMLISPYTPEAFGYGHNYWGCSPYIGAQQGTTAVVRKILLQDAVTPARTVFFTDLYVSNPERWRPYVRPPSLASINSNPQADYTMAFRNPGETAHVLWLDGHVSAEGRKSEVTADNALWSATTR